MTNQNFAFAEDYATLTDEELAAVQGGNSVLYDIGWVIGSLGGFAFVILA